MAIYFKLTTRKPKQSDFRYNSLPSLPSSCYEIRVISAAPPMEPQPSRRPDRRRQQPAFNPVSHQQRKRPPVKQFTRKNDFYVTNKSDFEYQRKECEKLLANPEIGEVFLHCIGNSMSRGINLALKLEQNSGGLYQLEVNTSTIELLDDLHPLNDEDDFLINKRRNSALHIRVFCIVAKEERPAAPVNLPQNV